ncbi:hypothetical protein [Myxococcus qinghaiensis]|uniref:hypothetical protein n=1 Tax=Myxococcus qinghaiensis TaxID=2906758 RepID=UPI0020A7C42F|nr:hypothetical protein [Myxococcus qinghaiensis]MCP3163199.1 hypothetical protein [Myxococcus qinghaiensis]
MDHYLPKDEYPEFSIYSLNLVPACAHCNSDEKGTVFVGPLAPARFIHPYFDSISAKPILSVEITSPYDAARIRAVPASGLSGNELEIVRFHVGTLLGGAFEKFVGNLWVRLPAALAAQSKGMAAAGQIDVLGLIKGNLAYAEGTTGLNSWTTGFYRGVLADAGAVAYLAAKTAEAGK